MHPMRVDQALSGTGLFVRGAFHPREDDRTPFPAGTIVLIGNAGPTMWRAFGRGYRKGSALVCPTRSTPGSAAR